MPRRAGRAASAARAARTRARRSSGWPAKRMECGAVQTLCQLRLTVWAGRHTGIACFVKLLQAVPALDRAPLQLQAKNAARRCGCARVAFAAARIRGAYLQLRLHRLQGGQLRRGHRLALGDWRARGRRGDMQGGGVPVRILSYRWRCIRTVCASDKCSPRLTVLRVLLVRCRRCHRSLLAASDMPPRLPRAPPRRRRRATSHGAAAACHAAAVAAEWRRAPRACGCSDARGCVGCRVAAGALPRHVGFGLRHEE